MNLKKNVAVLGAATSSMLIAGVAFAAWTSSGAGVGSAKAQTSADSVIAGVTPSPTTTSTPAPSRMPSSR